VRTFLAKTLLCLSVGLLFGHQFIAHQHEEVEIVSHHHDEDHDADHHHDHIPPHDIAHIFNFDVGQTKIFKAPISEISLDLISIFTLAKPIQIYIRKEYIEIRPPDFVFHRYFSLRAPPVA